MPVRVTENEEVLYLVMKSIEESQAPIGAGAIQRAIAPRVRLSPASVGIILRDLQDQGLVVREGYKGHRLAPKGREFLERYRNRQKKARLADRIFDYLTGSERQRLVDILEARRAIETEAARLAASRADEMDLRRLSRNVEEQGKTGEARQRSLLDREFHAALLDAAHNPLLNTLFDFSEQLTAASDGESVEWFLSKVREEIGETLAEDHLRILRAVSDREAEAAEKAMAAHMDRVLAFLQRTVSENFSGQG